MILLQLLAACAVGALLMYGYTRLRGREDAEVKRLRARLTAKTDELAAYKSDVQEHFLGTAKAVDALTRSYQDVFEQLERDARRLVGDGHFQGTLKPDAADPRTPELATTDEAVAEAADGAVAESAGKPADKGADDVLDNPASAAQRPVSQLTPSRP